MASNGPEKPHAQFGRLLSEGIASVAHRQHKYVAATEQEIAEKLAIPTTTSKSGNWVRLCPKSPNRWPLWLNTV